MKETGFKALGRRLGVEREKRILDRVFDDRSQVVRSNDAILGAGLLKLMRFIARDEDKTKPF